MESAAGAVLETPTQSETAAQIQTLFRSGNVEGLLATRNPHAQLPVLSLLLNSYNRGLFHHSNPNKQFLELDLHAVPEAKLSETEIIKIQDERRKILTFMSRRDALEPEIQQMHENIDRARYDSEVEKLWKEDLQALLNKQRPLNIKIIELSHKSVFSLRKNLLLNQSVPDEYKIEIIEGFYSTAIFAGYGISDPEVKQRFLQIDKRESELLKDTYNNPGTSHEVKKAIVEAYLFRLGKDPSAIEIVPFQDFETFGINADEVFAKVMGCPNTTAELVETSLAPKFFPDIDPIDVLRAWKTISKLTHNASEDGSFYFASGFYFKRGYFLEFLQNQDVLTPLVTMMSKYGFNYAPVMHIGREYSPLYIDGLKQLAPHREYLEVDLQHIKKFFPNFSYNTRCEEIRNPVTGEDEMIFQANPYLLALREQVLSFGENDIHATFEKAKIALAITPKHWKEDVIGELVTWASERIGVDYWEKYTAQDKQVWMSFVNDSIRDETVSGEMLKKIGKPYFEASLMPGTANIEPLFSFLQQHADKIMRVVDGKKVFDADTTWFDFVIKAGDVYRYNLNGQDEEHKIALAHKDLNYALQAADSIGDRDLRDKAYEHLVYAFTDVDLGSVEKARLLVSKISNPAVKADAQQVVDLEGERERLGKSSGWKKSEKVRRTARANIVFLRHILGYGTEEERRQASHALNSLRPNSRAFATMHEDSENAHKLAEETAKIKDNFSVSINLDLEAIEGFLKTGKLRSIWDDESDIVARSSTAHYAYGAKRDEVERTLNNRAKGSARDPHPIYGAVMTNDERDQFFGGAFAYGMGFLKLKPEAIRERTNFVYDDSFGPLVDYPFSWEQAAEARAMLTLLEYNSPHRYIEAQVLGGVTLQDVESINIPQALIDLDKGNVEAKIAALQRQYPDIKINIIREANKGKLKQHVTTLLDPSRAVRWLRELEK